MKEQNENNKQDMNYEIKDIKETLNVFTTFMMDQNNILADPEGFIDSSRPYYRGTD